MEEELKVLLEQIFGMEEFADCFLVDIQHSNKKLEIFLDTDQGIRFDKCQKISRLIENEYLDVAKPLGDQYTLEVSSPGVGRPLKFYRQYPKNIGRNMEISVASGETHTGQLKQVSPQGVVLSSKVRKKEGNRNVTVEEEVEIPFQNIVKSVVKISF